ncbi:MAG: Do family serine endopeptidase [Calditrichae bacterium]|nr:Do family serine endopeptidase [Calditrichia bacterium]
MDEIKKLAVLFTGVLIIGIVVWMVSRVPGASGYNSLPKQSSIHPLSPEPEAKQLSPVEPRVSAQPGARQNIRDSIAWRKTEPVEPAERPVISGAIPFNGNPNAIFVGAAQKILPAVVSIENIRKTSSTFDLLHPFLKRDGENDEEQILPPGSGSGIVITPNGYILTNNHVIEDAKELRVKLYDKREFEAKLVGTDPTTDIAVIRIEAENLPAAYIGDSDSVQIGEWVMAVGNPLNFTSTVTAGIVSALGRNINIIDGSRYRYKIENFIQTDAVINPGNSGGALVNLSGEVVGINTAIATRSGYYQGYGFSIPINLAQKVSEDLINDGYVRRAILGVSIDQVSDRVAKAVGLPKPIGALIQGVTGNSPAQKAGLQQGDIVLAVNGSEVVSVNDLQIKIAQNRPGDVVAVVIWRDGKKWEVDVELGEAPDSVQLETETPVETKEPEEKEFENFGLTVRELTKEEQARYDITEGLIVEKLVPNSPADRAGIYRLDVILQIDDMPVKSLEEFNTITRESSSGDFVKFQLKIRGGTGTRMVFIEVP